MPPPDVDTFPYSKHATTPKEKARERELYYRLNPQGPINGHEWRVIGWVRVDVRFFDKDPA